MPDSLTIFCERCGAQTDSARIDLDAHYCVGCERFTCSACWDLDAFRCGDCRHARYAYRPAVAAAGQHLDVPATVHIEKREPRRSSRLQHGEPAALVERQLARLRTESTATAARMALIRLDQFGDEPLQQRRRGFDQRSHSEHREDERSTTASLRSIARWPLQRVIIGSSVMTIALVLLALVQPPRPTPGSQAEEGVATAPPAREGIAGSNTESSDSPTPAALESASPAPFTANHQFDDLPMGAAMDAGWSVSGSVHDVVVAAYPTAIDRSLQMRRGPDDLRLCRLGAPGSGASSAAVDFLFDLAVPPNAQLLHLRAATGDVELVTTEESTLVLNVSGRSISVTPLEPMTWYRVMLQVGDGVLLFSLLDPESGAELSRSSMDLDHELAAEAVCFELPAGAASDLYVDDLFITT